jgi:homoaconitate hydratase
MGQTIVEKIAQAHLAEGPQRPLRTGDFVAIRPHRVMTHDNTSAVIKKFQTIGAKKIQNPKQLVFALDHDIQNKEDSNLRKYQAIEGFAKHHGVDFYPAGSGIGHQIMVERGYVLPGTFVVASDSHSNMYGALGAVGTPIVRTDAAAAWATGDFWWQIPRSVQVVLEGALPAGASGKDVIVTLCGLYNHDEVLNAAVEFSGPGVASLSMDARFSISNMSTEWGPLVGWFPVDVVTIKYLQGVKQRLALQGIERFADRDITNWTENPPQPDPDAVYAARIVLDLSQVTPHVSGPDTVQIMASLAEIEKQKIPIQKAYLLSCVNSRVEDLAAAATVLRGKKVAPGVKLYLGAASKWVQEEAERRGIWQTLLDAGANPLPAGCGPCIGLGVGLLEPGEVGISATNRNFKGRMGSRDAKCYLASPEVVAASAAAGYIRGHYKMADRTPAREYQEFPTGAAAEKVEILPGFPERVKGRLIFLPQDNVNTDAIYGKDYTYRDDVTPETMAQVVMENYDPQFAARTHASDVVVSGFNFGTGSSREQAVTCLKAKGIPLVIAASFSQTYLRNAYNNGFLCVEVPELVKKLREQFVKEIGAKEKTIIPGDEIAIDFTSGMITWRGEKFAFPALGSVPQSLVIAQGVENLVAKRLGLV